MKKLLTALFLSFVSLSGFSQDFPEKPNKLVNDYTGTLSSAQVQQLEQKLIAFDDSTSNQIVVAIMKSVGDYDINEYALELGRKWGIGNAGKNNGIIILVALGDRKISIQTGYGLEGVLPDIYAKRIIENDIKPYFKSGDYYAGLESGTDAIIKYTKGEYKNDKPKTKKSGGIPSAFIILIIIIVIVIIAKKGGRGGGGRGGGGSQVIGGRGVADALFWSMLLGGGRSSGGGGWGGGSGSSGGGGFGGFGGGSFGGGGSSGSW